MASSGNFFIDVMRNAELHCARSRYHTALNKQVMHSKGDNSFHDHQLEAQTKMAEMRFLESVMRNACK